MPHKFDVSTGPNPQTCSIANQPYLPDPHTDAGDRCCDPSRIENTYAISAGGVVRLGRTQSPANRCDPLRGRPSRRDRIAQALPERGGTARERSGPRGEMRKRGGRTAPPREERGESREENGRRKLDADDPRPAWSRTNTGSPLQRIEPTDGVVIPRIHALRRSTFELPIFIRGIAAPSVGLQRILGKVDALRLGDEYFFSRREEKKRLHFG